MTRQLLLIVLCLLPASSLMAQDGIPLTTKSRWALGISAAPYYEYRMLKVRDGNQPASSIKDNRDNGEIAKWGYSGGLNVRYKITKRLYLGAGLHYSNLGYKTKPIDMQDFDPLTGYGVKTGTAYTVQSFRYLEVPLSLDWCFYEQHRLSLYLSAGITPGILLFVMNSSHIEYVNGSKEDKSTRDTQTPYNSLSLSPTVALGARYKISSRSVICLAPQFRYGILSVVDAPIREFLWSGGVSVGYYRDL